MPLHGIMLKHFQKYFYEMTTPVLGKTKTLIQNLFQSVSQSVGRSVSQSVSQSVSALKSTCFQFLKNHAPKILIDPNFQATLLLKWCL